MISVYISCSC